MIIEMEEGVNLGIVGFVVRRLQDKGCDVSICRKNGNLMIAALGLSADGLSFLFMEGLPGIKSFRRDNGLFLECNGDGYEEAWRVLQLLENKH